tara:strand:+ start:329 stop:1606 length:1278 start_codon:yes stop_codon:yes gene_type:complete
MKKIIILYIFVLYILCLPNVLIKTNIHFHHKIIFSALFALLLFIGVYFLEAFKENMEEKNTRSPLVIASSGIDNLQNLLNSMGRKENINVNYENDITNKETSSTEGTILINNYNKLQPLLKKENTLNKEMNVYREKNAEIDDLQSELDNLEYQINAIRQKLSIYSNAENELVDLQNKIPVLEASIASFGRNFIQCKKTVQFKNDTLTNIGTTIEEKNKKLSEKNTEFAKLTTQSQKIIEKIDELKSRMNTLDSLGCCEGTHFIRNGWFNQSGSLSNSNTSNAMNDNSFKTGLRLCSGDNLIVDGSTSSKNIDKQNSNNPLGSSSGTGATDTYSNLFVKNPSGQYTFSGYSDKYSFEKGNDDGGMDYAKGYRHWGPYFEYSVDKDGKYKDPTNKCNDYILTHGGYSSNTSQPRTKVTVNGMPYNGC